MNPPNQPHRANPTTTNATTATITPPDGWQLRPNLTQEDMVKLVSMHNFCQQGVSRVAAMRTALVVFQQNQAFLAPFQPPHRNVVVHQALQEIMATTSMHWQFVTLVYDEFLRIGFRPPPKTAGPSPLSPTSNSDAVVRATADV